MATSDVSPLASHSYLDELDARGQAIYDTRLKERLEPEHNDEFVVIHVDTGDYAVGRTFRAAKQAMLARHPVDGRLFGRKIGPGPDNDALVAHILASESGAGLSK